MLVPRLVLRRPAVSFLHYDERSSLCSSTRTSRLCERRVGSRGLWRDDRQIRGARREVTHEHRRRRCVQTSFVFSFWVRRAHRMLDARCRGDQVDRFIVTEACTVDLSYTRQSHLRGQSDRQGEAGRSMARRRYAGQTRRHRRVEEGGAFSFTTQLGRVMTRRTQTINTVNAPRGSWSTLGNPDHTAIIVSDAVPSRTPQDGQPLLPSELHSFEVIEQSKGKACERARYDLSAFSAGEVPLLSVFHCG